MKTSFLFLLLISSVSVFGQKVQSAAIASHSGLLLEIPAITSRSQLDFTAQSIASEETAVSFPTATYNNSGELEKLEVKIQYTCQGTRHNVGGYLEFIPKRNLDLGIIYISPNCNFGVISAPNNARDNLVTMFFGKLKPALSYNSITGTPVNKSIVASR